jgi:hypothetical protein
MMKGRAFGVCMGAVMAGVLACAAPALAVPHSSARNLSHRAVCGPAAAGSVRCDSQLVIEASGKPFDARPTSSTSGPAGYHPTDLQSAYNLPSSTGGSGQTVAIVDAYNDPNAASDVGIPQRVRAHSAEHLLDQRGKDRQPRRTLLREGQPVGGHDVVAA